MWFLSLTVRFLQLSHFANRQRQRERHRQTGRQTEGDRERDVRRLRLRIEGEERDRLGHGEDGRRDGVRKRGVGVEEEGTLAER